MNVGSYLIIVNEEGDIDLIHSRYLRRNADFSNQYSWRTIDRELRHIPKYMRPVVIKLMKENWLDRND